MTDTRDTLPAQPAPHAANGERDYYRRRIDELMDQRLGAIEDVLEGLGRRQDSLAGRLNYFFGGLAVIIVIAQVLGPTLVDRLVGG